MVKKCIFRKNNDNKLLIIFRVNLSLLKFSRVILYPIPSKSNPFGLLINFHTASSLTFNQRFLLFTNTFKF